jgi:hypothetical protein
MGPGFLALRVIGAGIGLSAYVRLILYQNMTSKTSQSLCDCDLYFLSLSHDDDKKGLHHRSQ